MNLNAVIVKIISPESDSTVTVKHYHDDIIHLINCGHAGVILYFSEAYDYAHSFIEELFAGLILRQGKEWFINSNIMIDADNPELKDSLTNFAIKILQSESSPQSFSTNTLTPLINATNWFKLPTMKDRVATEQDFTTGNAVFFLRAESGVAKIIDLQLPHCAILHSKEGDAIPVIVVQAEEYENKKYIGMYTLDGNKLIGFSTEIELVEADTLFKG